MEIIYITFTSARFRGSPAQPAAQVIRIRGSPRGSLRVTRGSKALVRKGILFLWKWKVSFAISKRKLHPIYKQQYIEDGLSWIGRDGRRTTRAVIGWTLVRSSGRMTECRSSAARPLIQLSNSDDATSRGARLAPYS